MGVFRVIDEVFCGEVVVFGLVKMVRRLALNDEDAPAGLPGRPRLGKGSLEVELHS